METIGSKIKKLRRDNNLSLMTLASEVGMSDMALSKIETGKTKSITIDKGKGLARALGVSFAELFEVDPTVTNNAIIEKDLKDKELQIEYLTNQVKLFEKLVERYQRTEKTFQKGVIYSLSSALSKNIIQFTYNSENDMVANRVSYAIISVVRGVVNALKSYEIIDDENLKDFNESIMDLEKTIMENVVNPNIPFKEFMEKIAAEAREEVERYENEDKIKALQKPE